MFCCDRACASIPFLATPLANVFLHHAPPLVLGFKDELDGIAESPVATGMGRDVVGFLLYLGTGVFHGDGQTCGAHGGEIDDVVSDETGLFWIESFLLEDFFEAGAFVAYALMHVLQ